MQNKFIITVLSLILSGFLSCVETSTGSGDNELQEENDNEIENDADRYQDEYDSDNFQDNDQIEITYVISVETERFEGTTCNDITIDEEGSIYIVGERHNEGYLAKIDGNLEEKWRIVWNEDNWQGVNSVKVLNNHVYVSGNMMDYNFFSKFDGEGNEIWNKTTDLSIYAISIDKNENIYIGGKTNVENEEEPDAFFAKYDKNGDQIWLKNFGNENYEVIWSIALDSENSVYGSGFKAINNSMHTQFTVKYSSNGAFQWERVTGDGYLWATTVDGQDKIFSTGVKNSSVTLYEFHSEGTEVSEKNFGSGVGMGLDRDKDSNLYLSGYTTGALEGFSNKGSGDSFLVKMDSKGNELWATQWGSEYNEQWQKVVIGPSGEIFVTHYEHVLVTDDEYYDNMNRVIISKITEKVK